MSGSALAVFALLTNAFVWGVSWWPLRYLASHGIHSLWATALMYGLISIGLLLWAWRRPAPVDDSTHRPALLALFIAAGVTNCAFNWAVTIGEVVRIVLLFYLMPIWTLFLARWVLKEPLTIASWLRIGLCVIGAALVLTPEGQAIAFPVPHSLADVLGIIGGMGFAATNVALRRTASIGISTRTISLTMFSSGAVLPGLLASALTVSGTIEPIASPAFPWVIAIIGLSLAFLVGNLALQYGAARLPASIIAAVMPSEVVFASASAVLLAGEQITTRLLIGGCLIILAALLSMKGHATS